MEGSFQFVCFLPESHIESLVSYLIKRNDMGVAQGKAIDFSKCKGIYIYRYLYRYTYIHILKYFITLYSIIKFLIKEKFILNFML